MADRLREELGLTYSASGSFTLSDNTQQVARYRVGLVTGSTEHQQLLDETDQILERPGRDGVSTAEVVRAVNRIETQLLLDSKYLRRRAIQIANNLRNGIYPTRAAALEFSASSEQLSGQVSSLAKQCFGRASNRWLTVSRTADANLLSDSLSVLVE